MPTFTELGVPAPIVTALARHGVTTPFEIQALTIADALAGRDLCGRAPTGSGKTLAFAIPLALRVGRGRAGRPRGLVLVPTRELAAQVLEAIRPLAQTRDRSVAAFYGGMSISRDQQRLRRGVDVMVACPGRLADLVKRGNVDLSDVDFVVIDEADRMADMGFLPEVTRLLDATSSQRQTLLFSATLDGDVDVLVRRYQRDPVRHEFAAPDDARVSVRHLFWNLSPTDRVAVTADVVRTVSPAIVFTRTKRGADRVARQLNREGVGAAAIHGDRSQGQRTRALADFMAGRVRTLVATDVAARGIHVDDVGVVVHFDPPGTDKDYVHRSGRTGRAGADGVVVTLVPPEKRRDVEDVQKALAMPRGVTDVTLAQLTDDADPELVPLAPVAQGRPGGGRPGGGRSSAPAHQARRGGGRGRGAPARDDRGRSPAGRRGRPARSA